MPDERDQVDIPGVSRAGLGSKGDSAGAPTARNTRFLSLWFACANVYGRAHVNAAGTAYCGRCGKCGKTINFPIGSQGTRQRIFEVRCD